MNEKTKPDVLADNSRKTTRTFKPTIVCILVSVLLFGTAYQVMNWYGEQSWQEYLTRATSVRDAQVAEEFNSVQISDEDNFTKTPLLKGKTSRGEIHHIRLVSVPLPWGVVGDFRSGTFTRFDLGTSSVHFAEASIQKGAVEKHLSAYAGMEHEIEELLKAAERPHSRFETGIGFEASIPNFVLLRGLSQHFYFMTLSDIVLENPEGAMKKMQVVHKISEGLKNSPTLVTAMIRAAIYGLYFQPFYEGWACRLWTDEQYRQWQALFAHAEMLEGFDYGMRLGEKLGLREMIEKSSAGNLGEEMFRSSGVNEAEQPIKSVFLKGFYRSIPKGYWKKSLQVHHELLEMSLTNTYDVELARIYPEKVRRLNLSERVKDAWPFNLLAEWAIPSFSKAFQILYRNQTTLDHAYLACALERYRMKRGEYPSDLANLVPEFASHLPADLISGQPPIYKHGNEDKFQLYSIGWNSVDDNGQMTTNSTLFTEGDLAWPFALVDRKKTPAD